MNESFLRMRTCGSACLAEDNIIRSRRAPRSIVLGVKRMPVPCR